MKLDRVRFKAIFVSAALAAGLLLAADAPKADVPKPSAKSRADELPHKQTKPPGPPLSPEEAIAKMALPDGFKIECVAREPLVINPTSFTWDDRGRIWVTESVEYPRATAGKGQDRIKILEDTDGDGVFDKATIFKDGLNIPCGVAIGNGGVYVTNSPDILFLEDTNGDGVADKETAILTGFGRNDRHELPNSLTWGPDGWLYGMNGVFNGSRVRDPATGKVIDFTCAIWRYHPPTKRFELFSEGTSNPWGLDFNRQGDWFVSCCVIDHLFHMTQSGYYHRQGGPYPPMTRKLPSICTEKHQQAAYAGLCIYDADAYPEEYRGRLIMGNLHGSALNQDVLTRDGATYKQSNVHAPKGKNDPSPLNDGTGSLDFLQANDVWFMPVAQKIGPDGCIYVMDWYDRYHCYQDANRDPEGLDRLKGRIYRISYKGTPIAKPFDLQKKSADELLALLANPNVWYRRTAQRILNERDELWHPQEMEGPDVAKLPASIKNLRRLKTLALDPTQPNNANMHALWLLAGRQALDQPFHLRVLSSDDAPTRNWGVRAAGEAQKVSPAVFDKLKSLAKDPSPDVRVQVAVAAGRLKEPDGFPLLQSLLLNEENAKDPLIPTIIYNNLKPLVAKRSGEILKFLEEHPQAEIAFDRSTTSWIRQAINAAGRSPKEVVGDLSALLAKNPPADKTTQPLQDVVDALAHANLRADDRAKLFDDATRLAIVKLTKAGSPARVPATIVSLWWKDPLAATAARAIVSDIWVDAGVRAQLVTTLAESAGPANIPAFAALANDKDAPVLIRQAAVDVLGSMNDPQAADVLIGGYKELSIDLKPMAVNSLTHSAAGGLALLSAMEAKTISPGDVTVNHARQLLGLNNVEVSKKVSAIWGTIRTERDPERVKVVEQMRKVINAGPAGEPIAGQAVFNKICAQCHTIYGSKTGNVGPDLTGVGRENVDAILTNVLDPSLVIGLPYVVYNAKTKDGEVVSGILVEKTDKQVVLKDQTKTTTISTDNLAKLTAQEISMMPEGLEKTMTEKEFKDLVAFLLTREPPR